MKEGAERRLVAESGGMYGGAHNNTQLEEGSAAKLSGPGSPQLVLLYLICYKVAKTFRLLGYDELENTFLRSSSSVRRYK